MDPRLLIILAAGAILFGCLYEAQPGDASAAENGQDQTNQSVAGAGGDGIPTAPGTYRESMESGGYSRTFLLHIPQSYDGSRPYPLILVFHGHGGTAEGIARTSGFSALSEREGFIVAYPQGLGMQEGQGASWNVGDCCGFAMGDSVDDLGFVSSLMDRLEDGLNVDRKRIYVAGMSNGGMMSYFLGCSLADRVAAIAPVSGAMMSPGCQPSRPVSVIAFHGTADSIPYEGGSKPVPGSSEPREFLPVRSEIGFWAGVDGCTGFANATEGNISLEAYAGCRDGTAVALFTIINGTHSWPGSASLPPDSTDREISATKRIWEFFRAHPKS